MQTLISNKDKIIDIIKKVESLDKSLFRYYNYPNIPIYDDTISIVMTANNRSNQTYYTLKRIEKSSFKHIHVIIVDDSDEDPIISNNINGYAFHIDLIYIRRENKNWINPVINYNIGFKFIKGSKVIIQNSEVCHVGDVLGWISKNITDNNYYSFDVKAIYSFNSNNEIYKIKNLDTSIYSKNHLFSIWYHGRENITNYHFLTAMTRNTFELVKNFSYDYTLGIDWDDNDFVLKIKSNNIKIINLFHDEYNLGGIHLYHNSSYLKWKNYENNFEIYNKKNNLYNLNNKYIDILENNVKRIKEYYINHKSNLLKIQSDFLELNNTNLILIFDKKKFTKEMNSFRKCMSKRFFYKNSRIKLPKNLNIKILFK